MIIRSRNKLSILGCKLQMFIGQNKSNNSLLTKRAIITGKYQTGVLKVRTEPGGRRPYIKDPGLVFSNNDQADEVNRFIIWRVITSKIYSIW